MPTTISKTVKPSGGDYTSLAAALSGNAQNLVTNDSILVITCFSMVDTTAANDTGYTTDATHTITIKADATAQHVGVRDATKYQLKTGAGFVPALNLTSGFVTVQGIQICKNSANEDGVEDQPPASGHHKFIDVLIFDCLANGLTVTGASGAVVELNNCIFEHCAGYGCQGPTNATLYAYNCDFVNNGTYGLKGSGFGTVNATNCYAGANTTAGFAVGSGTFNVTTCASSDGSLSTTTVACATGSGARFTSVTAGSENLNIGSSSSLKANGTDLHADSHWVNPAGNVDVVGTAWGSPWSIGAFEVAVSAPTLSSPTVPSAGATLTATLSQSGCIPTNGTGGFTLSGTTATVASWAISGTTLTLTLTGVVEPGETVTYSYDRATTTDDISESTGTAFLANFSGTSVTNNSGVPLAPSGLTATAISSSEIDASWTNNAVSPAATGWTFQYDVTNTFATATSNNLALSPSSLAVQPLSSSTTYYFRVRATNAAGFSNWSNVVSAKTLASASGSAGMGTAAMMQIWGMW